MASSHTRLGSLPGLAGGTELVTRACMPSRRVTGFSTPVFRSVRRRKSTAFRGFTETRTGACRRGDPGYGSTGSTAHPMTKLAPSGLESPTEPM